MKWMYRNTKFKLKIFMNRWTDACFQMSEFKFYFVWEGIYAKTSMTRRIFSPIFGQTSVKRKMSYLPLWSTWIWPSFARKRMPFSLGTDRFSKLVIGSESELKDNIGKCILNIKRRSTRKPTDDSIYKLRPVKCQHAFKPCVKTCKISRYCTIVWSRKYKIKASQSSNIKQNE